MLLFVAFPTLFVGLRVATCPKKDFQAPGTRHTSACAGGSSETMIRLHVLMLLSCMQMLHKHHSQRCPRFGSKCTRAHPQRHKSTHTYTHTYKFTHIQTWAQTHIQIHTHTETWTHKHTYSNTHISIHSHTNKHKHAQAYHISTLAHISTHSYPSTNTDTHTPEP